MIDPILHIFFIFSAISLSLVFKNEYLHLIFLVGGASLLLIYSPASVVLILAASALSSVIFITCRNLSKNSRIKKLSPYMVLLLLFSVDFNSYVVGFPVATIGVSFSIIRIFITTKQLLGSRSKAEIIDCYWIFCAAFYLPALVVGPVFSGLLLKDRSLEKKPKWKTVKHYRLILFGLMLSVLFSPILARGVGAFDTGGMLSFSVVPILLFLQLFTAFWGQSLIAENSSFVAGYSVPVNFIHPWKARDIRDFWQRWHRSMANFVMTYIYLPLQLNGISGKLATIISFVFMGLWHNISFGYFLWGIGHGLLLVYWPKQAIFNGSAAGTLICKGTLWVCVIGLSFIANHIFH